MVGEAEAVLDSVDVALSVLVSVVDSEAVPVEVFEVRRVVGRVKVPLVAWEAPVPAAPVPIGTTPVAMMLGIAVTTEGWLVTTLVFTSVLTEGWLVTTEGWLVTTLVLTLRSGSAIIVSLSGPARSHISHVDQ